MGHYIIFVLGIGNVRIAEMDFLGTLDEAYEAGTDWAESSYEYYTGLEILGPYPIEG